ncbi:hypothetical protein IT407_01245 [Candidatus Uhrbacteria bacterium]|nr:hypothetical protein [Candidatus Uhrbacteria bacterium]
MFLRHFSLMVLFVSVIGCGTSHLATMSDSGTPPVMGDAGPPVTGRDSGFYEWPDSGPVIPGSDAGTDAGTDAGPIVETALRIVFDGPADSTYLRGSQDVVMYHFTLTAYEDLEIRRIPFTLEGLTAADRIVGSAGTEYFRDLKIKDADTGMTVMGPISLGDGSFPGIFADSFVIHAGETRHFIVTMDLANTEDAANEFYGDGNNRYRVTIGQDGRFFQASGVRRIATGEFITPEEIENNVVIPGNEMTIVDAELAVAMAAIPSLTMAVSNEPLIPSVGLVFTASEFSDVLVRSVRLSGVGNLDGTDSASELNDVITACALFNGDVQVGLAQTPDAVTGSMLITNVNVTVPSGASVTLVARCTADSVVAGEYDIYTIGIADDSHVVAERTDGSSVFPAVGTSLLNNALISTGNFVIVHDHGLVTVQTNSLRQSTILVAGPDVWQNMAQFRITAQYEPIELEIVRITSRGEAASFTEVAVAVDGAIRGSCILPAGTDRSCDAHLDDVFRVSRDSGRVMQLWARVSHVVSSASVGGATSGVARSGNRIRLGIAADVESGEWDPSYVGMLNMRFTGVMSGDRLLADGPELIGNEFVVRRTKPTVTRLPLSTATIANGVDQDLYRFQISANSAGSVGLMGFTFMVDRPAGTSIGLRIRRGATDIPTVSTGYPDGMVTLQFLSEEVITGSGNVYTVHGVLDGFAIGDAISITPYRDFASANAVTGYVASDRLLLETATGSLFTGLLWSDMSEIPHSSATRMMGGSFDWTGDTFVEDLTQTQVLTR